MAAILLALLGPAVVLPLVLADRNTEIGLLNTLPDLIEDLLFQVVQRSELRVHAGILEFQERNDLGALRILEP